MKRLKVFVVSSEAVPLVKTGGLGDVTGSLPPELSDLGQDVTIILPAYHGIDRRRYPLVSEGISLKVPMGDGYIHAGVLRSDAIPGVTVRLIDQPDLFGRKGIYGDGEVDYPDNGVRFGFFSKAILELIRHEESPPDIIHCNDWQTAMIPVFLRTMYADDPFFREIRTVFTIHNIAYQGLFRPEILRRIHLPLSLFTTEGGLEFYGDVSFLKGGILFSDSITTVSPTYCREIQTAEFGYGMEGVLKSRSDDLIGIRNGIDVIEWNPAMDTVLPESIRPGSREEKEEAKRALLVECGLAFREDIPVIGIVSRLAAQKGFDLVEEIADDILALDVQMTVLGIGDKLYEKLFERLRDDYVGKVFVNFAFDDRLAHMIYGGSDMFLMPSRYEPCGLGQMIAMRYGTVPIARKTGGLADTIVDEEGRRTGFLFTEPSAVSLLRAIHRAYRTFQDREAWLAIMNRGMEGDYSWKASARQYLDLYNQLVAEKPLTEVVK
jgi:starch synthase